MLYICCSALLITLQKSDRWMCFVVANDVALRSWNFVEDLCSGRISSKPPQREAPSTKAQAPEKFQILKHEPSKTDASENRVLVGF